MRQKIEPPTQTLPVEESLFALAKAASANILVDATRLPSTQIKPYAERVHDAYETPGGSRANLFTSTANQGQLSYERSSPDTFILWAQPDIHKLTALAVAEQKQWDQDFSGDAVTLKAISEFFANTKGWNPEAHTVAEKSANAQGADTAWKLGDFPVELQAPIKNELAHQVLTLQKIVSHRSFNFALRFYGSASSQKSAKRSGSIAISVRQVEIIMWPSSQLFARSECQYR